jgi:hypothetical protein
MQLTHGSWTLHIQDDSDGHLTVSVSHIDGTPVIDVTDGDISVNDFDLGFRFSTEKIEDDYKHQNV